MFDIEKEFYVQVFNGIDHLEKYYNENKISSTEFYQHSLIDFLVNCKFK